MIDCRLGWVEDEDKQPGQAPDWDVGGLLSGIDIAPEAGSLNRYVLSVLNQGSIGSCVANAGFQAIRMKQYAQGLRMPLGARLWGYYLARAFHGMQDWDTGTQIRSFFRAMNKFGFMAEADYTYKYNVADYAQAPQPMDFMRAFDQRAPTHYYRIFDEGHDRLRLIKMAIAEGHPVVFGTKITREFVKSPPKGPIAPPKPGDEIVGGHAMVIVGYDSDGFLILNSWGPNWGSGGFATLAPEYITWERTKSLWVVAKAPELVFSGEIK